MRDYFMESWLKSRLLYHHVGPAGHHGRGWSWIGGCAARHILKVLHPEISESEPKGAMYPGTMCHEFMQNYAIVVGSKIMDLEVLGHEQEVFIPLEYEDAPEYNYFCMSPIDTLVYDRENECFGVIDYKSSKDLTWVEQNAKEDNLEQINLYGYVIKAGWVMLIYIDKVNYDRFRIHRYEVDEPRAKASIEKLKIVNRWIQDENYRLTIPWTSLASGIFTYTKSKKPYRYLCEPSEKTPSYQGCPYKKYCLEYLSKEYEQNFTSFVRFDKFIQSSDEHEL